MAKDKATNQLKNLYTANMYRRQCVSLAMNVFNIKNLDEVALSFAIFLYYSFLFYK